MGTNWIFPSISFVTFAVTAILQLALAMDDIATSFKGDMHRVTLITDGLVFLIIVLSFSSIWIPLLLVSVIQGAIWINMSFSNLYDGSIFFMCYLICVAVTVDINKGDVMVVIGPSGSGKSTFLRSLNLLEVPTSGSIIFEGTDITQKRGPDGKKLNIDLHRQKMGMVFQHFNLFPVPWPSTQQIRHRESDKSPGRNLHCCGQDRSADT